MTENELEKRSAEIFEQLLELPSERHPAAAVAACAGDDALLIRVNALLNALPLAGHFMVTHTPGTDQTVGSDVTRSSSAWIGEQAGDQIGPYMLLEKIGEGGFGIVFMAQQERPVRRRVALKVIKMGMDTREVVARFEAERQALALMDHPNIAKVFDAGATQTGRPYFVMELVRGQSITHYADQRKLPTRDRVALASQVCRAVQHAHSKGVIHRDIKPSNVLVTVTDDKPIPKVIDFGIAKATQFRLTERTLFTTHSQLIGTPQYMSPEQADSDGADIDTRSDIYSIGVLIYELLVGTTPLDARSLRSAAYETMRKMIIEAEPPRPSTRLSSLGETLVSIATNRSTHPKELGKQLHGELDWIVMRALEKERARRYETAAALADDLQRYLNGEAVLAGPVSGAYRLKKALQRHRAAFAVGAALAACLLLGVGGTTWGLVREARQHQLAEQRRVASERSREIAIAAEQKAADQAIVASAKAAEASVTLEFITTDVLAKAGPTYARDVKISKVLADVLITPALARVNERFVKQPLIRATIQITLARTLGDLGRADLAAPVAKSAWDSRRTELGENHPATIKAMEEYAVALELQSRWADAEPLLNQALQRSESVLGKNHRDTLIALSNYATLFVDQEKFSQAEPLLKRAWDAERQVAGDNDPDTLVTLNNYAAAIAGQSRWADAEPLVRQAWEGRRRVQGESDPGTLTSLGNYADVVGERGRWDDAEPLFKKCWELHRQVQGDDHPATLLAMGNYGTALGRLGRHEDAAKILKEAWDRSRRVLDDDHPDTRKVKQDYEVAVLVAYKNRALNPSSRPANRHATSHPAGGAADTELADDLEDQAGIALNNRQGKSAAALYAKAIAARRKEPAIDQRAIVLDLIDQAKAFFILSQFSSSLSSLKEAVQTSRDAFGKNDPMTVTAATAYAKLLQQRNRPADASAVRTEFGLSPATVPVTQPSR